MKPSYAIESASVANQAAYDLIFRGNANGKLIIKDSKGNELINNDKVEANKKVIIPVVLELGNNKYTVTFTPDEDYKPGEYEVLSSYDAVTFEHSVLFRQYGESGDSLYVSPEGSVTGNGTKKDPLDIYTAVKYVQAGQTIVLMEGIQISRYLGTDEYEDWPAYNLILNCTSYENADKGYEDADGFAAKLTVGDGNVFDGCIAHHNADDGWDLFAKVQSGSIGNVVIRNSVAYKNGYVLDENGKEINAGNGNGFKMGGDSMSGQHELRNSVAFFNKAKGIDSNSSPDIKVYDSISFNNESYNVALYTNSAVNTDYLANGVISYRTDYKDQSENLKPKGTQDETKIYGTSNFYWDVASQSSVNKEGATVSDDWFESLSFTGISRNADGTINLNGFLKLTDKAQAGGNLGGTGSDDITIGEETDGRIETGNISGNNGGTNAGSNGESNAGSGSSSEGSSESTSTITVSTTTVKIEDAAAPTLPAGYTYEQVNVSKDGILRAALLNKYYGQKVYFAAIFGKNFGMTIDMQEASAVAADLQLSYTMLNMPAFAAGFDTIHAVPNVRTKLPMSVTLHFGVGNEYTGRIAYIYVLAEDEKSYKLVTAMPVNEIGNVAIKTADFTDVMILIAK
ncbi:MAG: hypothetical protein MR531_06755 [Lachnospiraceae bacterium]|nr:hypothetical protein [Lachnospiraceae bacterium]